MTVTTWVGVAQDATGQILADIELIVLPKSMSTQDSLVRAVELGGALILGVDPKKKWIIKKLG